MQAPALEPDTPPLLKGLHKTELVHPSLKATISRSDILLAKNIEYEEYSTNVLSHPLSISTEGQTKPGPG